jgi:hypothetical protein
MLFEQAAFAHLEVAVLKSPGDAESFLRRNVPRSAIAP